MDQLITELLEPGASHESAAARLARHFAARGMAISDIMGEQLIELYQALGQSAKAPNWREMISEGLQPYTSPDPAGVLGVIVETRQHPALEYVVELFSQYLQIPIQVFHGARNEALIRGSSISTLLAQGKVVLTGLGTDTLTPADYNALLLSREFWHALAGRGKVLIFQTDSVLCGKSVFELEDFLDCDYIGSKWQRRRPIGLTIDGGSGGLSLRDWERSVECLDRFPARHWRGGEDAYFAFHMELIGARVGKPDACARFSTQGEFLAESFGAHQISLLSEHDLAEFLSYCPEAAVMLHKCV
jgi:hypothetical protein